MKKLERILVALIALHSIGVGLALLFGIEIAAPLLGFGTVAPRFFAEQGGAFHLVLGTAYWLEYRVYGGVRLILFAKASAFVFLVLVSVLTAVPWIVPLSAVADGAMGIVMLVVHRRAASEAAASGATTSRAA